MSLKIKNFQQRNNLVEAEHKVLDFWDKNDTFKRSIQERSENNPYIFYDGPPFATGTPHYGHILASTIKDVIPRYQTMKGHRVERVWGWDCHGLPIENIVEKQLDLKGGKKGIEELGIDKFNQACRKAIWKFDQEWERVVHRIGRWVDFKNSYKTMDTTYMESVWWAFKTLFDKDLIYEGRKVILYCPRCATPLSNFEIAMDNSYKDVEDYSIYIKFQLKDKPNQYLLAWTTTPWTLIGNVGLAVNPDSDYIQVQQGKDIYYLAKQRQEIIGEDITVLKTLKGSELDGLEYQPLYTYLDIGDKKAYYVTTADFVSLDEGTGIVHTAAIYGEDDYTLASQLDLPLVPMLDEQGKYLDFVTPLKGMFYLKAEDWVNQDLQSRGLMYKLEKKLHSVAHCYRCDTKLYYNAVPAWFVNVQKLKKDLKAQNEHINWYPDHLKYGRFGKGLETAPDWNISRSRYWGTPMPIWQGEKTGKLRVIGSREELKKWAVDPKKLPDLKDIHREFIDDIKVWVDDEKTEQGTRIPEVFDCWVESGSMPFASIHYPFQNKQKFEDSYPAQFIAEYIAQTRAWFYTLHVISVGLFDKHSFDNAVTTGNIQAEDGQKMSKSKKNYPDPEPLFERYGVDALRFYLMASQVMKGDNTNFSENGVKEVYRKLISTLWNTFSFYKLYAGDQKVPSSQPKPDHVLDKWITSKTNSLIIDVTKALDDYDTVTTCRLLQDFVTDLSTWYLRRSRDRLRDDKKAQQIFAYTLNQLIHLLAPTTPFVAELIHQNLSAQDSIHLNPWPQANSKLIDTELEKKMELARKIVEALHALRQKNNLKIRQPLSHYSFDLKDKNPFSAYPGILETIEEETNVKAFVPNDNRGQKLVNKKTVDSIKTSEKSLGEITVYLDIQITPQLQQEGEARELIRQIQQLRKKSQINIDQKINLTLPKEYQTFPKDLLQEIKSKTLVQNLDFGQKLSINPNE